LVFSGQKEFVRKNDLLQPESSAQSISRAQLLVPVFDVGSQQETKLYDVSNAWAGFRVYAAQIYAHHALHW